MTVTEQPLPLKLCVGWGVGTLGVSIMFNSITILLQRFATDYLGIAAVSWAGIFLLTKLYDAVTDPLMGMISDRTRSPLGRRRVYLPLGMVISVIAFYALFHAPAVTESSHALLVMLALLLLFSTGYTIFNVPYMSMLPEMTEGYRERARLVSFRIYGVGLGTVVGLALGPALVAYFGGGRDGHLIMAAIFSALVFLSMTACFFMTADAKQSAPSVENKIGWVESWSLLWQNKPFMRIIGLKLTQLCSVAMNQTMLIYFVVYVLEKDYQFLWVYGLIAASSTMLGPYICLRLLHRFDKRSLYLIAALIHTLFMVSWLLVDANEPVSLIIIRGAVLGMTAGAMIMTAQAMLPDTISYETLTTGLNREGVYSGLYTTTEKLAFALGGSVSALILGMAGYVSSTTGGAVQPESAVQAIYLCVGVLPAMLALASCLFLIGYDLTEEKLNALRLAHS